MYTVLTGIAFLVIFPKSPEDPVSFMKIRFFNERESHILKKRVDLDDPAKANARPHVSWSEFKRTVSMASLTRRAHRDANRVSVPKLEADPTLPHRALRDGAFLDHGVLRTYPGRLVRLWQADRQRICFHRGVDPAGVERGVGIPCVSRQPHGINHLVCDLTQFRDKFQRRGAMVFIGIFAYWCFTVSSLV